jgi:glycosyltransferase involved in cell wall biosynthesis
VSLRILYFAGTHGDWGGSSRVLFTNLALLDRSRFEPIVALNRPGPAEAILERMGIRCLVWGPLTEPGSPTAYLRALFRTVGWLRRNRIDLVHYNRANDWRPAEHIAARLLRIPVVTHFHMVNHDRTPATRMSTAIAAVSRYVAEHSDLMGVPVHVIHNAVDADRFAAGKDIRAELGLPADAVVVTFAGEIRRIKGIDTFLAAAGKVRAPHVRFLIVGSCRAGPGIDDAYTENELQQLIAGDGRITYAGYRSDMPDVYRSSDVLVMASRCEEAFGLVALEAAAAGKPVVATRVGGIPEVVVDGQTGFLAQPGDAAGLAERIQQLVDSPTLRAAMGERARERARTHFTTRPVRELERLYESLCPRPAGGG